MRHLRRLAGPFFIFAGAMHFLRRDWYVAITPPYLPEPELIVYASGVAEIVGGVGLLSSDAKVRRLAGWWTLATLLAVFPANVYMFQNAQDFDVPGGKTALALRLPFQGVFAAWVWSAMRAPEDPDAG